MAKITDEVAAAIRSSAHMLSTISHERLRDEFLKGIDSAQSVVKFMSTIDEFGLFQYFFPNATINQSFLEERDHAVLIAWLLNENGVDKSGSVLQSAKYTSSEVKAVKFLVGLKGLSVQTSYILKKAEPNSGVTPEQMMKFGEYVGVNKKLLQTFVRFNLSITGDDLKGKVKPGPEMGSAIRDMEIKKFEDML